VSKFGNVESRLKELHDQKPGSPDQITGFFVLFSNSKPLILPFN
jgi:hypothetical protein